jgi:hypothetical protein
MGDDCSLSSGERERVRASVKPFPPFCGEVPIEKVREP